MEINVKVVFHAFRLLRAFR